MGNYYNHDFVITKNNKLTLQTVELPTKIIPGKLQVSGQGVGCALIQVKVKYVSTCRLDHYFYRWFINLDATLYVIYIEFSLRFLMRSFHFIRWEPVDY